MFCVAEMSLNQFMSGIHGMGACEFISDSPMMAGARKQEVHAIVEDGKYWFERWGSSGQAYDMDKVGGALHTHFTKVSQEKLAGLRQSAVAKHRDERLGSLLDELKDELKLYRWVYNCYNRQAKRKDACLLYQGGLSVARVVPLLKCGGLTGYQWFTDVKMDGSAPGSEADAMRDNIERMKKARMGLYLALLRDFLGSLDKIASERPMTGRYLLSCCDLGVSVPEGAASLTVLNSSIGERLGSQLTEAGFVDSMANLCAVRVAFFYPDAGKVMRGKAYWKGGLV